VSAPLKVCVGLTGPNASGKGEVALFLKERGFSVHSLSDEVREEATRRGLDHTRDHLIATGTSLREKHGDGVLAERILPKLGERSVVDSIRNPGEIRVLRSLPGFHLLGIDAPIALRFERSSRRGRTGDGGTLQDFARKEALEKSSHGPGQQLDTCFSMADLVVENDQSLEELHRRITEALTKVGVRL
jgi:dephospho-CoA kinase